MNKTHKILAAVLLLGIAVTLFFGLRRGLNPPIPPTETQPSAIPHNNTTKPDVVSTDDGGGVITFATYPFLKDAYQPIIDEFRKQYPSITVQLMEMPATLDTRAIASAADTTLLAPQAQNSRSYFLDLSPFEDGDPAFKRDDYWPGILESCEDAEGRVYGLPVFVDPTGIYYQEKAFDAAGLPYPGPGWTWNDFEKAVNALTRSEKGLPVYGFADDSFMDTPDETLLSPRISYLLDQTGGEIDVERLKEDLGWYLSLVKSGSLYSENIYPQRSPVLSPESSEAWSQAFNVTWIKSRELFVNHPPAMWKGNLAQPYWGDIKVKALADGSLNMSGRGGWVIKSKPGIGWAPFPISADGKNDHTTPNMVTCAVISAGTEHPRAAWTWLNFLASHPVLTEWSLSVPSQSSAAEASGFWGKIPEKLRKSVRFGLEHGWYSNPYPEGVLAVNQAVLEAVSQNTSFEAALQEASRQVEAAVVPTVDMTPIVVAPPQPTAAPSVTTIDYFSPFSGGSDQMQNLAEAFHHLHPGISVQVADSAAASGVAELADAHDCFAWLPEKELPVALLDDLDQFLATEKVDMRDDFTPQQLAESSQDGKLFGLPTAYRPNLIYYNTDLLTQRGLKPPAVDWTYSDFIELINAAASNSQSEPIYGFALEYPTTDTDLFLAGRNVRLVDAAGDIPTYLFDTPETRDSVQWLAEQVKSGVILPVTPATIGTHQENATTVSQLILDGQVAFWISWIDQGEGGSYSLQDASFRIGVAPIPLPNGTVAWRPNQVALMQYISRKAENPRACWDWIKFLSEQPDNGFGVPARRSVRESAAWVALAGVEAAKVYETAVEQRRMISQDAVYSLGPTRDWWNELLADVVSGADPLALLAKLQGKADAYSACLATSSGYQAGDAQQKSQAATACAAQVHPK